MVSKFQKVINFLYRRFVQEMGREPATPKEMMDIQNEAVRHFNKTKGVSEGPKKTPFQGFTPKVIEGGKSKEGIGTLFKDSPEAIAKIKAENKAAIERLKKKKTEFPTLEKMPKSSQTDDLSQEIKKGVEDVMKDTSDEGLKRSIETDNLKLEFPGISDEMINNILADTNPQRIAEVKQTMREALKMGEKGMSPDEIIKILKDTTRTKQASGGRAGSGLNYLLGEDDQNVRMPHSGGIPGLLGE